MIQPNLITYDQTYQPYELYSWLCFGIDRTWYIPNDEDNDYATGATPPRYPMPAIPIVIAADSHNNCTWVMRDDNSEIILDCYT